ncbi:hypothetical protein CHS0354_013218 [Potamilus streckersoni]|uniref:Uncharacterized protein n=1 Tax=Potamilus streckersoni TaxID=2493646 RepID=A0AAE0W033_9BIVA|nr:hypothetical protein CHS0354_013218 [Potamilus streckersoni]
MKETHKAKKNLFSKMIDGQKTYHCKCRDFVQQEEQLKVSENNVSTTTAKEIDKASPLIIHRFFVSWSKDVSGYHSCNKKRVKICRKPNLITAYLETRTMTKTLCTMIVYTI